jgi:hypothetical protein
LRRLPIRDPDPERASDPKAAPDSEREVGPDPDSREEPPVRCPAREVARCSRLGT